MNESQAENNIFPAITVRKILGLGLGLGFVLGIILGLGLGHPAATTTSAKCPQDLSRVMLYQKNVDELIFQDGMPS